MKVVTTTLRSISKLSIMKSYRHLPKSYELWTIGQRVDWLLHRRKLNQTDAAKLIGISQATIANIIGSAARKPSAVTLMKMARALDCAPSFILDGTGVSLNYRQSGRDDAPELLKLFKELNADQQKMVMILARTLAGKPSPTDPS